jgi:signal transduction histidine kinase
MTRFSPDAMGAQTLRVSPQRYGKLVDLVYWWAAQWEGSLVMTERLLTEGPVPAIAPFVLLLSPTFNLLIQTQVAPPSPNPEPFAEEPAKGDGELSTQPNALSVADAPWAPLGLSLGLSLTFEPELIQAFAIELLTPPLEQCLSAELQAALEDQLDHPMTGNQPAQQSQFTLALMGQCLLPENAESGLAGTGTGEMFGVGLAANTLDSEALEPRAGAGAAPSQRLSQQLSQPAGATPMSPARLDAAAAHGLMARDFAQDATVRAGVERDPGASELVSDDIPVALRLQQLTADLQAAWDVAHTAERAKAEFLAMMSHELRTPLTCVIGMSATLLRWSFGPLSDRQRDYLQSIHDSGEHLLELIESILDLSQAEAGRAQLQVQQFSLRHLVSYCVQLFQEMAARAKIQLKTVFVLTPEEDTFAADPQRVRQILINLLDNAIKFTQGGGGVTLRVYRDRQGVVLQISDTGIGIEPAYQPLLFQKFQQLENSHRRRYQGSGLGLALTQQQVQLHGGTIEMESSPGAGSTFTVWLPQQPEPALLTSPSRPQGTVILLEDDEESAALICELLTASGFKVFWLVESSTALEQILTLKPVAAIIDLQIRGSGGDEIIEHIHTASLTRRPKIIALAPEQETARQFVLPQKPTQRADAYIFRPLQPQELVSRLCSLIQT